MLTASQLCPVPSPPPPLEYAMASAVIVLKNIAIGLLVSNWLKFAV
tara:strand:+ start:1474 stop:1611 length:138 start_codon:yes stop_codon:yes gene_type:complete